MVYSDNVYYKQLKMDSRVWMNLSNIIDMKNKFQKLYMPDIL